MLVNYKYIFNVIFKLINDSKFHHFTIKNVQKLIKIGKVQMLASSRKHLESFPERY